MRAIPGCKPPLLRIHASPALFPIPWPPFLLQGLNALHCAALGGNAGCMLQLLKKAGLWGTSGPAANKELMGWVDGWV